MNKCIQKLGNLDEIHRFLETQNLRRLNHAETDNRPITSKDQSSNQKNLPTVLAGVAQWFVY